MKFHHPNPQEGERRIRSAFLWCDHPACFAVIDRGLAYVCGGQPYGGEWGCGLYFCLEHLAGPHSLCERCAEGREPFEPAEEIPPILPGFFSLVAGAEIRRFSLVRIGSDGRAYPLIEHESE